MIELTRDDVPHYLRNGDFYLALSAEDESPITVPMRCCAAEIKMLQCLEDAEQLLGTLSFWLTNDLPGKLIDYAVSKDPTEFDELFQRFERTVPALTALRMVANNNFSNRYCIAARHGSVQLLKYFKERGEFGFWDEGVCEEAIKHGHLDCLQFAHQHGCALPYHACLTAAQHGHLACLQYAHEHGSSLPPSLCDAIAWTGRLDCLQYAHEHGCVLSPSVMTTAARRHYWDCMKYGYEHGEDFDVKTCVEATRDNRLDILMYAHQHGCELAGTAYIAMSLGRLDCFKYAYAQDPKVRQVFAEVAAGGGHLECLKYALELHTLHNVELSLDICTNAARVGSLACLQFAHDAGCAWHKRTCEAAAANGHLECLKYAHENGCSWGARTAKLAADNGHWHCWRYLYANKCPGVMMYYWKSTLQGFWKALSCSRRL